MTLPTNPLRKAVQNPRKALNWLRKNGGVETGRGMIDRYLYTPLLARNLFDTDWDLAIVLDACRYDTADQRVPMHSIELEQPESAISVGSHSIDWMRQTFAHPSSDTLSNIAYITGNPHTEGHLNNDIGLLDEVWRYGWDTDAGTIHPRPITDRAIEIGRSKSPERMIVHYMQPHLPPLHEPDYSTAGFEVTGKWIQASPWERLRENQLEPERVIESYEKNLDSVLDEVSLLLSNIDSEKVIVTADHGNYLGERGRWGHPRGHIHDAVRRVPWFTTKSSDEGTREPDQYNRRKEISIDARLGALGYR